MKTIERSADVFSGIISENDNGKDAKDSFPSRLLSFIYRLDVEFPLSGGETDKELRDNIEYVEHEAQSLMKGIDANFPLSGGN